MFCSKVFTTNLFLEPVLAQIVLYLPSFMHLLSFPVDLLDLESLIGSSVDSIVCFTWPVMSNLLDFLIVDFD